jgi:hypothetical protein
MTPILTDNFKWVEIDDKVDFEKAKYLFNK